MTADTLDPGGAYLAKAVAVENRLNNLAGQNILNWQGQDGGNWQAGYRTVINTADCPQCASIGQVAIASTPVGAYTYSWAADLVVQAQSANSAYITMGGPATSDFQCWIIWSQLTPASYAQGNPSNLFRSQTTIGTNTGLNSGALISGQVYPVRLWGYATFTAPGNLVFNQASSASAASFTVKKGMLWVVYPQN